MNKIVQKEGYPASKLPSELRQDIDPSHSVTVVVTDEDRPSNVQSLEEIIAARKAPFRTVEEIDSAIERDRDAWDA
ncbi:MAG: hypothetical protein IT535_15020 [Bauldia sp.]|nr:hypothetical protein [Bauldia sp.]